jgi:hypothetical protein
MSHRSSTIVAAGEYLAGSRKIQSAMAARLLALCRIKRDFN